MNSLSKPRYDVQKQVNVYRAILKTKTLFENVVTSQFAGKKFEFSLFHVKFDVNLSASPKKTIEKKKALAPLYRKQNYFWKKSIVCKITSKSAFTPSGIDLN